MTSLSRSFPLSFAQQRLWLLDRLAPGTPLYNITSSLRLEGSLSVAALALAFAEIVRRHESLRTVFAEEKGSPVQRVTAASPGPLPIPVIDLAGLPEGTREAETQRLIEQEARRPFDLSRGPLFRIVLVRLGPRTHCLAATMHHIISDGWSVGVLHREFQAAYTAFLEARPAELPELPVQYVDFALWQRDWFRGDVLDQQLAYWRKKLADLPPLLHLPTDRARPPVPSFRGSTRTLALDREVSEKLRELGRKKGLTLFAPIVAAFKTLLHRYSNQAELAVGTVSAGRNRVELEGLIGFFVNTLVLRSDFSDNPTFAELVDRVAQVTLEALSHQDVPFEKLVEELHPQRTLSHTPLFQVIASQNPPGRAIELPGLEVGYQNPDTRTAKFDIAFFTEEGEKTIEVAFEYSSDLFDATTIERMLSHLQQILAAAVVDDGFRVDELPLLRGAEQHQVLTEWNDSREEHPRDRLLHELFEAQADGTPDAVAVISDRGQWSYGFLDRQANRLARHLSSLGVGPEVPVAIYLQRGFEAMVAVLGILKAGGAYLGLDLQSPPERVAWVLEDSGAPVVLTVEALAASLPENGAEVVYLDGDREVLAAQSAQRLPVRGGLDNLHCLVYTSGSTGRPKGTLATARNYLNLCLWFARFSCHHRRSRSLLATGLNWDASFRNLFTTLLRGGGTVMAESGPFDPARLLETIRNHRVTVATTPMSMLHPILQTARHEDYRGLVSLEYLHQGGEALVASKLGDWLHSENCHCTLTNIYGLTETSDVSTGEIVRLAELDRTETIPVGRPVSNHRLYILSHDGQTQPVGVPGEICIAGEDALTRGYHNRPGLTAEKFMPDPFTDGGRLFRTGDLARLLPDGRLEYAGRADHQVKIRGMRIELGEIEEQLRGHPGVRDVVVLVKERSPEDKRLVAWVVRSDGEEAAEMELSGFLHGRVPDYMVPAAFVFIDELPLSASGKIDRKALPEPRWGSAAQDKEYVPPQSPEEEELARIYADLLGLERVGAADNFFELGGHSLLAIQLLSRIREALDVEVPLQRLFQAPTVAEFARVVAELSTAEKAPSAGPIQRISRGEDPLASVVVEIRGQGTRPPIFCIHPAMGDVLCYQALADALDPRQPFYGLQSPDPEILSPPFQDLGKMAAAYLEAIRRVGKEGPFVLAGWSQGGVLAFEIAHQARTSGVADEPLLALLDPTVPGLLCDQAVDEAMILALFARELGNQAGQAFEPPVEELEALEPQERWDYLLLKLRIAKVLPPGLEASHLNRRFATFRMNVQALQTYDPVPYHGPAALFLPEERLEGLEVPWLRLLKSKPDVFEISGDHQSFLRPPHVESLARKLEEALRTAFKPQAFLT